MSNLISEFCRTGRCSECANPKCTHECHKHDDEIRALLHAVADCQIVSDGLTAIMAELKNSARYSEKEKAQ